MLLATATALLLGACGGGSSSSSATAPAAAAAAATTSTISGSAVKGPVANATVTIKNAATGATLATAQTSAGGAYSVDVQFDGDVIVEVSGGTYIDEATSLSTPLASPMKAVINVNGNNVTGIVTPLTTLAYSVAFGNAGNGVTASAFNTAAGSVASQFQLNGVNLAASAPTVGNGANAYGKVLQGVAQYLNTQNLTLQTFTNASFTAQQWTNFSANFSAAYNAINPNSAVSFSFDGTAFNIAGTGAGGGSGTCGIRAQGTISTQGITVPIDINYCISGIAAGSCTSGNSSLSQALSGQGGVQGAANLNYSYSATCASGAIAINLQ